MQIFQYVFIQRALIVCVLISVMVPLIGTTIVLKRLSAMGDALSHASLAGVAIGLAAGVNPLAVAVVISVLASLAVEYIRRAFPRNADIAANVVLSAGIGTAAVFSGFIKNAASFNSFLFGSLITVDVTDMWLVTGLSAAVILFSVIMYKELLYVALDEEAAKLSGVPVRQLNSAFTVMTAITVSVAARTVGALMISSLLVIPVACSIMLARSYFHTMIMSISFALLFTISGLFISFYFNLKPGGVIVLVGTAALFLLLLVKKIEN